jgi:hypothetical protein
VYQLEVKRWLVAYRFPPTEGWRVHVDIDAMERAKGGQHKPGKAERARTAESALLSMGATIGAHPEFGRADIVAEHPQMVYSSSRWKATLHDKKSSPCIQHLVNSYFKCKA